MFTIQGISPPAEASAARRRLAIRAAGFGVRPEAASPETAAGSVVEAALTGMLALQEGLTPAGAEAGALRDRQAHRRGRDLLAALADLQRAMLGSVAAPAGLAALTALAAAPIDAADPALARIVREIRLRACVELARYGVG